MKDLVSAPKETKTEKAERLKREKNPWEALEEIRRFARLGRGSVPDEWTAMYFKWWGIYTQGDGRGALGEATPFFMLRVGLPNGFVTSKQLSVIGRLAQKYARDRVAITVRQSLQFHWVTVESIPEILDTLLSVGLTSKGSSGDVLRGVTGCPLAGCLPDEIVDASPLAAEISRTLAANSEFYNLPRKIKVSVTGCPVWCSHPEINDVGLTAVRRGDRGGVFHSGGRRTVARAASGCAVECVHSAVAGGRGGAINHATVSPAGQPAGERRERARIKHLFLKQGWTGERFLSELERILGYRLDPAVPETIPAETHREHLGVHPQKQTGLDFVGAMVAGGELTGDQVLAVAELAEQCGSGQIRLTPGQNLIVPNVPRALSSAVAKTLESIGLAVEASLFRQSVVSCTGPAYCKMGIAETKSFSKHLVAELERRMPDFTTRLKINVTGCGNGCAHHHLSDIGLEGRKIKQNGQALDGFAFRIGGAVGRDAALSRTVGYQCADEAVPVAIERLLRGYLAGRREAEDLHAFLTRNSDEELRALLSGEAGKPALESAR